MAPDTVSPLPIGSSKCQETFFGSSKVSLYPALYRLEAQGWIKAKWGVSDTNRRARYYELTVPGRKQLAAEKEHWSRITRGIDLVLSGT